MKKLPVTGSQTQDTSGLSRQCSSTEPQQPDNHQPSQSSIWHLNPAWGRMLWASMKLLCHVERNSGVKVTWHSMAKSNLKSHVQLTRPGIVWNMSCIGGDFAQHLCMPFFRETWFNDCSCSCRPSVYNGATYWTVMRPWSPLYYLLWRAYIVLWQVRMWSLQT